MVSTIYIHMHVCFQYFTYALSFNTHTTYLCMLLSILLFKSTLAGPLCIFLHYITYLLVTKHIIWNHLYKDRHHPSMYIIHHLCLNPNGFSVENLTEELCKQLVVQSRAPSISTWQSTFKCSHSFMFIYFVSCTCQRNIST